MDWLVPGDQRGKARHEEMKPERVQLVMYNPYIYDYWTLDKTAITKALIEVDAPWEGNHVDSKLPQVCVELPREPKGWIALMFSTS